MKKPWIAIIWFAIWGLSQTYTIILVISGNWKRTETFPEEAYNSLIYAVMVFIPLSLSTSVLLLLGHRFGYVCGLFAGGAVIYVMICFLALSGLKGRGNVTVDALFLVTNAVAVLQITRLNPIRSLQ